MIEVQALAADRGLVPTFEPASIPHPPGTHIVAISFAYGANEEVTPAGFDPALTMSIEARYPSPHTRGRTFSMTLRMTRDDAARMQAAMAKALGNPDGLVCEVLP